MAKLACIVLLVGVLSADAKYELEWLHNLKQKAYNAVLSESDVASVSELTAAGKALKAESCGSDEDLLKADMVYFDTGKWTLSVKGRLAHELKDGNVSARIRLGEPLQGTSFSERMKRKMVFAASGMHSHTEPLCGHLARGFARYGLPSVACPMTPGDHTLHFSFDRLPSALVAGQYHVEVRAFDSKGSRVACLNGGIEVPRGKQGQLFRRLDEHEMAASGAQGVSAVVAAAFATMIAAMST